MSTTPPEAASTKVKIRPGGPGGGAATPTEQMLAAASAETVATDTRGRKFTLRRPGILTSFKLVEIAGDARAKNEVWMGMMTPFMFLAQIEDPGEPPELIFFPKVWEEMEALMTRLGDEGYTAIAQEVATKFQVMTPETAMAAVKK